MRCRDSKGPVAVIADDHVAGLYGDLALESLRTAGFTSHMMTFPAGEGSKTIETVSLDGNKYHGMPVATPRSTRISMRPV